MHIPVCKFGRAYFTKCFKDISAYSYCDSEKESYFGLKINTLITTNGYITNYTVIPANTNDRVAIWELTHRLANIKIIGDKGYVNNELGKQL